MNIAMISDIHFGVRNDSPYFLDRYQEFFEQTFMPVLIERGIKTVLILGDTWENRRTLNVNTFKRACEMFFTPMANQGIEVKIIYGNHDVYFKNTNRVNSIDMLESLYPNIEVVRTAKVFDFNGLRIAMQSWVNNENFEEAVEFIKTADASILCGHYEIKGFEMMAGHTCDHGFDRAIFDRYEAVYSGHFHVMSTDGRIEYISNPFQTNWGDYGLKKGFRILNTRTRELELIENPISIYEKINFSDDISVLDFDFKSLDNKIIRVYIDSFNTVNHAKLGLFLERLNQHAYNVEVFERDPVKLNDAAVETDTTDMISLINLYIDEATAGKEIDQTLVRRTFMDLYHEALSLVDTE